MNAPAEPQFSLGRVEPRVSAEFPGLGLRWSEVQARTGPSSRGLRERLRALSDRYLGARVVAMRTQPIAHAYRAFYRQTGLDPDVNRVPSEAAAVARLLHGGFLSRDRINDALLVALVETGVPVWALDAAWVDAQTLGIRTAVAGDELAAEPPIVAGGLVVADAERVHGPLFGPFAEAALPNTRTRGVVLFSVGVDGVPAIYLEEALWLCHELLAGP